MSSASIGVFLLGRGREPIASAAALSLTCWLTCLTNSSGIERPAFRFSLSLPEAGEWPVQDKSTLSLLWSQKSQLRTNLKELAANRSVPGSDTHAHVHMQHTSQLQSGPVIFQSLKKPNRNGISLIFTVSAFLTPFGHTCLVLSGTARCQQMS